MTQNEENKFTGVRIVTDENELPQIIELILPVVQEMGLNFPCPNIKKMAVFLYEIFKQVPIFVYVKEDEIIGTFIFKEESAWWSEELLLAEICFFVKQEHRSLEIANDLIDCVISYAVSRKLPFVTTPITAKKLDGKEVLFKRKGFKKIGTILGIGI